MSTGLVGAVSRLPSFSRLFASIPNDPLAWIIWLVAFAGINAVWMHSGARQFGFEQVAFNLTLGFAGLAGEYYLAREVCRSWHERALLPLIGFFVVWAGAFGYSMNSWTGVASDGQVQKANIQKAAYITSVDNQAEMDRAQSRYDQAKADRDAAAKPLYEPLPTVAGKAVSSAAEARTLIASYEGNTRFFVDLTNKCTDAKGKQSRAFCAAYGEAKASLAAHDARSSAQDRVATLNKEFSTREAELREARRAATTSPVITSDKRSDLRILVKYFGVSEETAMDINAMGKIILISLLLSGLGVLHENNKYRGAARRQWPFIAAFKRFVFGSAAADSVAPGTLVLRETTTEDPRALREVDAMRSRIRAALSGQQIAA